MQSRAARYFEGLYQEIREDIFALCRALNFTPTNQQADILRAAMECRGKRGRMAVKSGQGPGKSTIAVIIALWRLLQVPKSLVVLTAPTQRQCRDSFLTRAREIMEHADPVLKRLIDVSASKITICGDRDWAVKPVTASSPETAQGVHVKPPATLTIIVDEASGVERDLITQYKGTMSNPDTLMLMIGNPNLRDCAFFDCYHALAERWWTYTINCEDTARDHPELVSPERNQELEDEFGRDSDVYRVRVLGEFPKQDPDCVMSAEDLYECTTRKAEAMAVMRAVGKDARFHKRIKQFGIDFARMGGDENVVYQRLGNAIIDQWIRAHCEPIVAIEAAFALQVGLGWTNEDTLFVPDVAGLGGGAVSAFGRAKRRTFEFNAGSAQTANPQFFANLATEAWFHVRHLAKNRLMYIPKDPRLIHQLSTRRYTTNKKGQLIIWSKEDYIKESTSDENHSPDRADGAIQALYDSAFVTGQHVRMGASAQAGMSVRGPTASIIADLAAGR